MKSSFNITRLFFLLLLLLAGLQACEKDVSDKLKIEVTHQLVVISFMSPQDSALLVKLQRTQPAVGRSFTQEELKVKDAVVNLSDGSQTIRLRYDARQDLYRAKKTELPIIAGKTYVLTANTPNGWKTTATSTVPSLSGIAITTFQQRTETQETFPGNPPFTREILTFKWQDAAGRANYYRTGAFRDAPNASNPNFAQQDIYYQFDDLSLYFSDERQDGQEITSNDMQGSLQNFPKPYRLHLLLSVTDKAYYRYHRSIMEQRRSDDNPFAEPTLLYTNITGGLGVFSTYNQIHDVRQIN